jgi:hypothetical protein
MQELPDDVRRLFLAARRHDRLVYASESLAITQLDFSLDRLQQEWINGRQVRWS